jgi:hypothetical protein
MKKDGKIMSENIQLKSNKKEKFLSFLFLKEDDGGDEGGGYPSGIYDDYYDSMGGGMGGGDYRNDLLNTFVTPFTDIFKTALYGLKMLTAGAQQLVRQVLHNLPRAMVPFFKQEDYSETVKRRKAKFATIKGEYAEVLKRNMEYLSDHDLWGMAFMMDPSLMLGAKLVQHSPELTKEIIELIGFGKSDGTHSHHRQHESVLPNMQKLLFEDFDQPEPDQETVKKAFQENPELNQQLQIVRKSVLDSYYEQVSDFLSELNSFDDIPTKFGAVGQKVQSNLNQAFQQKKITLKDVEPIKQNLLSVFKKEYVQHYLKQLEELKKLVPDASSEIETTIKKIEALLTTK